MCRNLYTAMVKLYIIPLIFILIDDKNALCVKETLKTDKKHACTNNFPRKDQYEHYKAFKIKNGPQRCSIVCPIVIVFPTNNNDTNHVVTPINNINASATSSKITTKKPSTKSNKFFTVNSDFSSPPSIKGKALKTPVKHKHVKFIKHQHIPERKTHFKDKTAVKKYTYHDLNISQKRLLLKQLKLGNSNGRKAYEFRESSTTFCQVICLKEGAHLNSLSPEESNDNNDLTTATNNNANEDDDDSDEDSFEEGEDTPIEATVKPVPQNITIGGIRPFGRVDFVGMDDFGPNGELATDI